MATPRPIRPADSNAQSDQSESSRSSKRGVEANARLTGSVAAVLLVLLAAEGVTVLRVRQLLTPHVFIGMLIIPPVLLKLLSTGYRFLRYYTHAPAYQHKGPPPILLRLLGPFVVLSTVVLFASGVALLFVGPGSRQSLLTLHKLSFILWFAVMTIHVLSHLRETARLAPRDLYWRTRRQVTGAGLRQWTIVASVLIGFVLAALTVGRAGHFLVG